MRSFMQSPAAIFLRKRNENFSFKLPVIKSVNFQVDFRSSLNSMCKNILNAKENFKKLLVQILLMNMLLGISTSLKLLSAE